MPPTETQARHEVISDATSSRTDSAHHESTLTTVRATSRFACTLGIRAPEHIVGVST